LVHTPRSIWCLTQGGGLNILSRNQTSLTCLTQISKPNRSNPNPNYQGPGSHSFSRRGSLPARTNSRGETMKPASSKHVRGTRLSHLEFRSRELGPEPSQINRRSRELGPEPSQINRRSREPGVLVEEVISLLTGSRFPQLPIVPTSPLIQE
jgi:hypothetical protein